MSMESFSFKKMLKYHQKYQRNDVIGDCFRTKKERNAKDIA